MKYQMIPASTLNTKVQGKYFQMSLKKKSTIEDAVHCHSKGAGVFERPGQTMDDL